MSCQPKGGGKPNLYLVSLDLEARKHGWQHSR
jgi:hypothetical protein